MFLVSDFCVYCKLVFGNCNKLGFFMQCIKNFVENTVTFSNTALCCCYVAVACSLTLIDINCAGEQQLVDALDYFGWLLKPRPPDCPSPQNCVFSTAVCRAQVDISVFGWTFYCDCFRNERVYVTNSRRKVFAGPTSVF